MTVHHRRVCEPCALFGHACGEVRPSVTCSVFFGKKNKCGKHLVILWWRDSCVRVITRPILRLHTAGHMHCHGSSLFVVPTSEELQSMAHTCAYTISLTELFTVIVYPCAS